MFFNDNKGGFSLGLKEKLPLINNKSKGVKIIGYVVYAFIFLAVLGAILPSNNVQKENGKTNAINETAKAVNPAESAITVSDVDNLLSWSGLPDHTATVNGNYVTVTLAATQNALVGPANSAASDAAKTFSKLFQDNRIENAKVVCMVSFVDKYGKVTDEVGEYFVVSKATAAKCNWDNLEGLAVEDWRNLAKAVDNYYVRPSLR